MALKTSIDLPHVANDVAFERFFQEISETLSKNGILADFRVNGDIRDELNVVATIVEWDPPRSATIRWWLPETRGNEFVTQLNVSFETSDKGTRVTLEHEGWESVVERTGSDVIDWFTDNIAGHLLASMTPKSYSSWLIDRIARRPSGTVSKANYADPIFHRPNFKAILRYLNLTSKDYLLEVGCGGGFFLADAMSSGCRAVAIDHSPDMVSVATKQNASSIAEGRLEILLSDAEHLPFPDNQFTCAVSTGVFSFIVHTEAFFSEIHRVLKSNGRLVLFTGSKELKGTPAEPDPIAAKHIRYYEDDELSEMATEAGFTEARVERPSLRDFAIEAGIPDYAMELFSQPGGGGQFLLAVKS